MNYLIDTNTAGHLALLNSGISEPRLENLKNNLNSLPNDARIFFSVITLGEVEYGLKIGPQAKETEIQLISNFLKSTSILEINEGIASDQYASIRAKLFEKFAPKNNKSKKKRIEEWKDPTTSKELGIQENDLWIVATALYYNLILVSDDKMTRLSEVTGVRWVNWLRT